MDRYIVAGGLVVSSKGSMPANLLVEDGRITEWVGDLRERDLPIIDAGGTLILPGIIDAHTHFHMASGDQFTVDDFSFGGRLAASAGVTSIIDFIEPLSTQNLSEAIMARFEDVKGCPLDYQFHLVIPQRFARDPAWFELIDRYHLAAVKGFTTYREDGLCLDAEDLENLLAWASKHVGLLTFHAEDDGLLRAAEEKLLAKGQSDICFFPQSRPLDTEEIAIRKLLAIGSLPADLYFVHLSTRKALDTIIEARQTHPDRALWVETCPQYLVLDESVYEREADLNTVCPPLRTHEDQAALWMGIRKGIVDVVASDHCAFALEMKRSSTWQATRAGLPSVDAILPVLVNEGVGKGRISWEDLVRVTSENPARLFRLKGKGSLTPGHDADFVMISGHKPLDTKETFLQSRAAYSPFHKEQMDRRWLKHVVRRGEFLVLDGRLEASLGNGSFIPLG